MSRDLKRLSEKFDNKLILDLKVSYLLLGTVAAIHGGAAVIVAVVPLPWTIRGLLWAMLAGSLYISMRAHGRRAPRAVAAVELDGDGSWALKCAGDPAWHPCRLVDRWVHPTVVILRLRRDGARRATGVIIPADAVAPEPFRRLRARLRLERAPA